MKKGSRRSESACYKKREAGFLMKFREGGGSGKKKKSNRGKKGPGTIGTRGNSIVHSLTRVICSGKAPLRGKPAEKRLASQIKRALLPTSQKEIKK